MRRCDWWSNFGLILLACVASGCGAGDPSAEQGTAIKTYERDKLPKTTQELPPLDQGRVEIPTPEGWQWRSQEKGLLARFHLKGRSGIPQILIKIDSEFTPEIDEVTAENVKDYAESVQAQLDKQQAKYVESAKPLILGDNAWARYVIPGKLPGKQVATIERQILKTTRGGRNYLVELQVPIKELLKYRDASYAIAAGMSFQAGAAPSGDAAKPATDSANQ